MIHTKHNPEPEETQDIPGVFSRERGILIKPVQWEKSHLTDPNVLIAALCAPHERWQQYMPFPRP